MVKLVKVGVFKGNAGVGLIHVNTKIVLNVLNSQILSQGAELVVGILIGC